MDEKALQELLKAIEPLPLKAKLAYLEKALKEAKEKEIIQKIEKEMEKVKAVILEAREWKREGNPQESTFEVPQEEVKEQPKEESRLARSKSLENVLQATTVEEQPKEVTYGQPPATYHADTAYKNLVDEHMKYEQEDRHLPFEMKPTFYSAENKVERHLEDEKSKLVGIAGAESIERSKQELEFKDYKRKEHRH